MHAYMYVQSDWEGVEMDMQTEQRKGQYYINAEKCVNAIKDVRKVGRCHGFQ